MLSPALFSSYKQYKQDTNSVAAWLASTAKAYGHVSDPFQPPVAKPAGRLKGKARTQAKKEGGDSSASTSFRQHIIKIKDFVPLAESIAQNPQLSVPASFITTLDRVIRKRLGFSDKLEGLGLALGKESNVSHGYFIGILEQVRSILEPRMVSTSAANQAQSHSLPNQFAALELQEPSEEFLNAPDVVRPSNAEGDDATYEMEPVTGFRDLIIAMKMIINDLNKIRSHVEWIWSNYKTGFFDLTAAAIATNTAIDLGRNLTEDIVPSFERHGGICTVLGVLFHWAALEHGYGNDDLFDETAMPFNLELYDVAQETFMSTLTLIYGFQWIHRPGTPVYNNGLFGCYDASSDRKTKSGHQKFTEDNTLVLPFFAELLAVTRGVSDYPVEDECLRGMKEFDRTKKIPFYLVFAVQVFLDIHYTIREHAEKAFTTLRQHLRFFQDEIDEHFEFHQNLNTFNWPVEDNEELKLVWDTIQAILVDVVHLRRLKSCIELGIPVPDSLKRNVLLTMSPVLSGLMLYHFRAKMYDKGISLANACGSIPDALHLYNAVRHEALMESEWPDMEITRVTLGDSNFFVGEAPKTPADYLKRFHLQYGASLATMTDKRRQKVALSSRSGPRRIKGGTPVSCMFMDRYLRRTEQFNWTPEHVDQIIDLSIWEEKGSKEDGTPMLGQIDDPEKIKAKKQGMWKGKGKTGKKQQRKATESGLLPPEKLVRALAFALHGESFEFSLPYFSMHRQYWRALRAVKQHCNPLLRQVFSVTYMEHEDMPTCVVSSIFKAAADLHDRRLLVKAAEALDGFIRTHGQDILRLLHTLGLSDKTVAVMNVKLDHAKNVEHDH